MLKIFSLIVTIFLFTACFEPEPPVALKNTFWSLEQLNGKDALSNEGLPEVHIIFHLNDNTLNGNDGCNRLSANYTLENEKLSFSKMISTRMFCKQSMQQADEFLKALGKIDRMQIKEDKLILYNGDIELVSFKAKKDL